MRPHTLAVLAFAFSALPAFAAPAVTRPVRVLPWIQDDYTRAVAQARARKLPIFVEAWAPW